MSSERPEGKTAALPADPSAMAGRPWHAQPFTEALAALGTAPQGLSTTEAEARLARFGPNRLPRPPRAGPLKRLARQFHNLLIHVLLVAAALSFALGHSTDGGVILGVVIINAVIGFIQEGRAQRALDAIRGMIDPTATVMREGRRMTVAADRVVPGDMVVIEAGDRVCADLRLTHARNLRIDEALLTGESVPVDKTTDAVAESAALGDRRGMAYSGTFIAAGQGMGVAVATGGGTEIGRISTLIGTVETLTTPLIRQMNGFGRQLTIVILAFSVATFLFAIFAQDYPPDTAFMVVIGLAVAAIPEGLPAVMTIALAIGVQRMAARNAIIRRLPAVETLGSVSVICSDKTGTLTRNEMTVHSILTPGATYEATGAGYDPRGAILDADAVGRTEIDPGAHPVLRGLVRAGLLCNDAELHQRDGTWFVDGDPMEGALLTLAMKAGFDHRAVRSATPRQDEIPFDSQYRYMATRHDSAEGPLILIKGAPERVIAMCAHERHPDGDRPIEAARWHLAAERLAAQGQRVLAFAAVPGADHGRLEPARIERGAVLLGLIGFIDPPRPEAVLAVRQCARAGIRVMMVTGDHAVTAREIARQVGLAEDPVTRTGADIDAMDDPRLREAVLDTTVFARTTPEHKLRLVMALQANGLTVAMTGDGVNDAPALKRADVGVAMGRKGTEAAKESSDMVLADDNFASIIAAVREGRTVYDNLMKVIAWTLPTNAGEATTILVALILGLALPITPVQILWVNMVTAVALGLTLAFEPAESGTMRRPPRRPDQALLTGDLLRRMILVSAYFVLGCFGVFYWAEARGLPIEAARTLVVNTLVIMEIVYLFGVRFIHGRAPSWRHALGTPAILIGVGTVVLAQIAFTYLPTLQGLFESRHLALADGLAIFAVGLGLLIVVEVEQTLARRHRRRRRRRRARP